MYSYRCIVSNVFSEHRYRLRKVPHRVHRNIITSSEHSVVVENLTWRLHSVACSKVLLVIEFQLLSHEKKIVNFSVVLSTWSSAALSVLKINR